MSNGVSLRDQLHSLSLECPSDARHDISKFAVQAAELAMDRLKVVGNAEERSEARMTCSALLDEASRIRDDPGYKPNLQDLLSSLQISGSLVNRHVPKPTRALTTREQIVLWSASALNGSKFPPWKEDPSLDVFTTPNVFQDAHEFSMSAEQLAILDFWKRPHDGQLKPASNSSRNSWMQAQHAIDLVQEAGTDCSIVAALSAAAAKNGKDFPQMLQGRLFPYDDVKKSCTVSPNGKYIVRLYFNGCDRVVVIDDRLPYSKNNTLLHIVDRHNPDLLWPAMLEKAYLKVRGGYDFPGSNSATDLWMIAGWIPEEIFFNSKRFDLERTWRQVYEGFEARNLIATLGTGKMSDATSKGLGLVSNHNYAILDCKLEEQRLQILIKNPWVNGLTWRDYHGSLDQQAEIAPEGCFWMSSAAVVQHFETLYLNWDPRLYSQREDIHFTWSLVEFSGDAHTRSDFAGRDPYGSMRSCPQYVIENMSVRRTEALIVLSKYFADKSNDAILKEEFMSVYAFSSEGKRVLCRIDNVDCSEYSSSPHSLLRVRLEAHQRLTLAISQQDFIPTIYSFTLSAFANTAISLYRAAAGFESCVTCPASWTTSTAGGHFECTEHTKNPQFALTISEPSRVTLMIETLDSNLDIHVRLLHGKGHRCHQYSKKDIILDSGDYTKNFALTKQNELLKPGPYTAICSSFHAGATGSFKLSALTDCRATLMLLPRDGAGMFRKQLAEADLGGIARRVRAPMKLHRETRFYFTGRIKSNVHGKRSATPMRITLDQGSGPDRVVLIASNGGQFDLSSRDFRTDPITLTPHPFQSESLWLSVESMSGAEGPRGHHEVMELEMWHDSPEAAEFGSWREWDP